MTTGADYPDYISEDHGRVMLSVVERTNCDLRAELNQREHYSHLVEQQFDSQSRTPQSMLRLKDSIEIRRLAVIEKKIRDVKMYTDFLVLMSQGVLGESGVTREQHDRCDNAEKESVILFEELLGFYDGLITKFDSYFSVLE